MAEVLDEMYIAVYKVAPLAHFVVGRMATPDQARIALWNSDHDEMVLVVPVAAVGEQNAHNELPSLEQELEEPLQLPP